MQTDKGFKAFAYIVLSNFALAAIIPLLLLFVASFTDNAVAVVNGYSFLPEKWSTEAYKYILDEWQVVGKGYLNTILVTVIGTTISLLITAMFAYGLSINDLPGRGFFSIMVILTMLFNGGLVSTYFIYTNVFHVRDTYFALIIPGFLMNAFNIILVMNYYRNSISREILEAARIDGASEFLVFWRIMFPLSVPIMATIGINTAIGYWNDWTNGLYYLSARDGQQYYTIQLILNQINNDVNFIASNAAQMGLTVDASSLPSTTIRMAIATVGILPILIVYPFFQKYFVKGISMGGVKG